MCQSEISKKLNILEDMVLKFEKLVESLDTEFPHPKSVAYGDGYVFRHAPQERSDTLASYLKLVRIISLSNACIHLMKKGYVQEVYILCRAIDEALEDIFFFAVSIGETGVSEKQKEHLKEFYQEEHKDPDDPLSSVSRHRAPRSKVRAASNNLSPDPYTMQKIGGSISQTFSGFVHGAYVFIMEMYDQRYHMNGMPNSDRLLECVNNFPNHLYRALLAMKVLSHRVERLDIAKAVVTLNCELAEKTDCMDDEDMND